MTKATKNLKKHEDPTKVTLNHTKNLASLLSLLITLSHTQIIPNPTTLQKTRPQNSTFCHEISAQPKDHDRNLPPTHKNLSLEPYPLSIKAHSLSLK